MINPVRRLREGLGYTRRQFCVKYGVSMGSMAVIENGQNDKIYNTVIKALIAAGLLKEEDEKKLQNDYSEWLEKVVMEEIIAK